MYYSGIISLKTRVKNRALIPNKTFSGVLGVLYGLLLIWSAINPKDYSVWLLEMIGVLFMILVYIGFQPLVNFSRTTNLWFFIGVSLITIGAHYSFPDVPMLEMSFDWFGSGRNNFDKLGHLVQGIVPVLISWDVLVNQNVLRKRIWLNLFAFCVAMTISGVYELVEWFFIVVFGDNAYTFDVLGTQGYFWDSQSDMLCALVGAMLCILLGQRHLRVLLSDTYF